MEFVNLVAENFLAHKKIVLNPLMYSEISLNILNDPQQLIVHLVILGIIPLLEEISCIYCKNRTSLRIRKLQNRLYFKLRCKSCTKEYSVLKNEFFTFADEVNCRMELLIDKIIE